jgi:hypothetical protein
MFDPRRKTQERGHDPLLAMLTMLYGRSTIDDPGTSYHDRGVLTAS